VYINIIYYHKIVNYFFSNWFNWVFIFLQ